MTSSELKNLDTVSLVEMRKNRKEQMEKLQAAGWWDIASNYHKTYIAPINVELMKRNVW